MPTCIMAESVLESGLRLTAKGSATVIGRETSSSGGNLGGKKISSRLHHKPCSRDSSAIGCPIAKGFEINSSWGCAVSYARPKRSFLTSRNWSVSAKFPIIFITCLHRGQNPGHSNTVYDARNVPIAALSFAATMCWMHLPDAFVASSNFLSDGGCSGQPWQQT